MQLGYKPSYDLDPNATYIIAGGLGGLGRSAARWMVRRGARNLILLSRSGPKTQAALDLVSELQAQGIRTGTPECDVSSSSSLSATLAQHVAMPPVKGCLQATMVLQDSTFENMSYEEWTTSIHSKVSSSWNLHHLLPPDLDFFILLSSIAGIVGSPSQANYAAGNTYQDALARYRRSQGLKATSIDLGVMADVGIVAEKEEYARRKEAAADLAAVKEKEFWALLEIYCDPQLQDSYLEEEKVGEENQTNNNNKKKKEMPDQPIVGLITPAQFRAKGMEPPSFIERPLFSALAQTETAIGAGATGDSSSLGAAFRGQEGELNHAAQLTRADSDDDATNIIVNGLQKKLSKALAMSVADIDVSRPLHLYGVDSLLAVELRNWFAKVWKADVAVFEITGPGSLAALGEKVMRKNGIREFKGAELGE